MRTCQECGWQDETADDVSGLTGLPEKGLYFCSYACELGYSGLDLSDMRKEPYGADPFEGYPIGS